VLDASAIRFILWAYLAISVFSTALFFSKTRVKLAFWVFLGLNLFKLIIVAQDFQLRLNQHYMSGFVAIAFLFIPYKRNVLKTLIVLFYFWSGTLKLNYEWLSGAALYSLAGLGMNPNLLRLFGAYVVVLELVIAFGLLARKDWVFRSTLAQIVIFHIFSWQIVGFFYPTIMFTILAIFPLCRFLDYSAAQESQLTSLFFGRESLVTYATVASFSVLQLIPYAFPGDSAITGEGRLFALHMFDAQVICNSTMEVHRPDGRRRRVNVVAQLPIRIRCDPIVYFNVGHQLCRIFAKNRTGQDVDISLHSRRRSEESFRPVMDVKRFCREAPTYDLWRTNSWILK
jgi:hypothetical protein